MVTTIQCKICHEIFHVKGYSNRANEYGVHENADLTECCQHIQDDDSMECVNFLDFDPGD